MGRKEIRFKNYVNDNIYFINQLENINLSAKYTGYYYLIKILDVVINGEIKVKSFSREVYPIVAKHFGINECTIERNLRILIKNCWNDDVSKRLNVKHAKAPTCCNFLKIIIKNVLEKIKN